MWQVSSAQSGARAVRPLRKKGFTLIELVITVAIVALLATIAVPTYRFAVIKANRRAVQGFMMDVALRENQILLDRRRYATLPELGITTLPSDVSKYYTVTATPADGPPPSYSITATPIAGTIQADEPVLGLTSAGVKTPADKW